MFGYEDELQAEISWLKQQLQSEDEYMFVISKMLKRLTNEQRLIIFHSFCIHCGTEDMPCNCWRDE